MDVTGKSGCCQREISPTWQNNLLIRCWTLFSPKSDALVKYWTPKVMTGPLTKCSLNFTSCPILETSDCLRQSRPTAVWIGVPTSDWPLTTYGQQSILAGFYLGCSQYLPYYIWAANTWLNTSGQQSMIAYYIWAANASLTFGQQSTLSLLYSGSQHLP